MTIASYPQTVEYIYIYIYNQTIQQYIQNQAIATIISKVLCEL